MQIHVPGIPFNRRSLCESTISKYVQFLKSLHLKSSLASAISCSYDNLYIFHGNGYFLQAGKKSHHASVNQGCHRLSLVYVNLLIFQRL